MLCGASRCGNWRQQAHCASSFQQADLKCARLYVTVAVGEAHTEQMDTR